MLYPFDESEKWEVFLPGINKQHAIMRPGRTRADGKTVELRRAAWRAAQVPYRTHSGDHFTPAMWIDKLLEEGYNRAEFDHKRGTVTLYHHTKTLNYVRTSPRQRPEYNYARMLFGDGEYFPGYLELEPDLFAALPNE